MKIKITRFTAKVFERIFGFNSVPAGWARFKIYDAIDEKYGISAGAERFRNKDISPAFVHSWKQIIYVALWTPIKI